jgi:formate hydrogenlyase subunit 6/NADH:ubiquinone oxidoreductase subunit I
MSKSDIYQQLRKHLDSLPVGFPATKSGVELRILRRLFTQEEAEMACQLKPFPETGAEIAQRIGRPPAQVEPLLERMAKKGLISRSRAGGKTVFAASWFIIGIYEHQVATLTKDFAKDFEQYVNEALRDEIASVKTPQLRVIPVHTSITSTMRVAPYEDARQIIRAQSKIAVAECICKKEKALLGHGCDKPREVCLTFSTAAYDYIENGLGREITQEEALEILDRAEQAGLVMSPGNVQKNFAMCLCCGCCCALLSNLKKLPKPSALVASNYYAQGNPELCEGCETCLTRCQMNAITVHDGTAKVNRDYCIGCGLCTTTCPTGALTLVRKKESETLVPPANVVELYMKIGKERQTRQSTDAHQPPRSESVR